MKNLRHKIFTLFLLGISCFVTASANAQYKAFTLDLESSDMGHMYLPKITSINNLGQIAGYYEYRSPGGDYLTGFTTMASISGVLSTTYVNGVEKIYANNNLGQLTGGDRYSENPIVKSGTQTTYLTVIPSLIPPDEYQYGGINKSALALGINDQGKAVGRMVSHAALWNGSDYTDLGANAVANAINNSDKIVGYFYGSDRLADQAATWDTAGTAINLSQITGFTGSRATAVNDAGSVVGLSMGYAQQNHATLWTDNEIVDLGIGLANDINNANQIVGERNGHGAIWNGTVFTDLNDVLNNTVLNNKQWTINSALGINDNGWIIAMGNYSANAISASKTGYVLLIPDVSPVPLPASAWLFGSALLGLVGIRRKLI